MKYDVHTDWLLSLNKSRILNYSSLQHFCFSSSTVLIDLLFESYYKYLRFHFISIHFISNLLIFRWWNINKIFLLVSKQWRVCQAGYQIALYFVISHSLDSKSTIFFKMSIFQNCIVYFITFLYNSHISGFNLLFTKLNYHFFLCYQQVNTGNHTLDTTGHPVLCEVEYT